MKAVLLLIGMLIAIAAVTGCTVQTPATLVIRLTDTTPSGIALQQAVVSIGSINLIDNATGTPTQVYAGPFTTDLIANKNAEQTIIGLQLPPGSYRGIEFDVISAKAMVDGDSVTATIQNPTVSLAHPFTLTPGKVTTLVIDFSAGSSFQQTAKGYTLKPVVRINDI